MMYTFTRVSAACALDRHWELLPGGAPEEDDGGNASDSGGFPKLIDWHVDHLQNAHGFDYVVADSSLYSDDHVETLTKSGVKFVTRVPETIGEAKTRIQEVEIESLEPLREGYHAEECRSEYGGAEQRWFVV